MHKRGPHVPKLPSYPAIAALLLFVASTQPAFAYIGPGAGLGAILTTVAFLVGILLLLVGFVWFPLKRLLRRMRGKRPQDAGPTE